MRDGSAGIKNACKASRGAETVWEYGSVTRVKQPDGTWQENHHLVTHCEKCMNYVFGRVFEDDDESLMRFREEYVELQMTLEEILADMSLSLEQKEDIRQGIQAAAFLDGRELLLLPPLKRAVPLEAAGIGEAGRVQREKKEADSFAGWEAE